MILMTRTEQRSKSTGRQMDFVQSRWLERQTQRSQLPHITPFPRII